MNDNGTIEGFDPEIYNDILFMPVRINSIEARWSECNKKFEIVRHIKNPYYQQQQDPKFYNNIAKSLFDIPTTCCTIAMFDHYPKGDPDIRIISNWIFNLTDKEYEDFKQVGRIAWQKYRKVRSNILAEYRVKLKEQAEKENLSN